MRINKYLILARAENSDGEMVTFYSTEIRAIDKHEAIQVAESKWPGMAEYDAIKLRD